MSSTCGGLQGFQRSQAINSTKLRAMSQRVDYDTFKKMVGHSWIVFACQRIVGLVISAMRSDA